jgi:thymidylate synthase (FAD)
MNFRTLRLFFKERLTKCAQWEIRELAEKMLDLVSEHAPTVFEDIKKCEVVK